MICLDANDLVYSKDPSQGITSAGFSVDSIMMKMGISPIVTMNQPNAMEEDDVASLFKNKLVVPNWVLSYNNPSFSGGVKDHDHKEVKDTYGEDDDVLEDDLHDRLLDLVKEHDEKKSKKKRPTKKLLKKDNKKTRRAK